MKPRGPVDTIGAVIANRYRVDDLLGRGGMASVYRVHDKRLDRDVALKRCMWRDARQRHRYEALLEREYHTLAQVAHPCIIVVYDYGVDRAGPYYTMELLDGPSLDAMETVPWRTVCKLMCDVASSLAILHSRQLVHRDVSLRNVRLTKDERAKLIDFGAMISMGVAKDAVGTPPFMAPEVLQLQALDGRADTFSLGAVGYRMLTGRHAYPARRMDELRDVWRTRPAAPSTLIPEIPGELSALVMQMLALDRAARPANIAEVIERLRVIGDLVLDDVAEVSRAYLTTPALVGRTDAVVSIRKRVLSLVRGDGGLLIVRGESGSGRSRMLDACVLDGKLLGASVVRVDARDAASGEWGVARALAQQLGQLFPEEALAAARLSRNVLAYLIDELRTEEVSTATSYAPERSVLIRDAREWVLELCKAHRLLVVVDDAERIDEPSLALLSALAHRAPKHALLLALAVDDNATRVQSAAMRLLYDFADVVDLQPLDWQQTEALIRSLFGDAPSLTLWSHRIHELSQGNPRAALELAQHMVDTGTARYEAGSWILPVELGPTALPSSFAAALSSRLTGLSSDARELADVFALTEDDLLPLAQYATLTEHRQVKRVFAALEELVTARILRADADGYAFTQRTFPAVIAEQIGSERRERIHVRAAQLLASSGGGPLRRAHHLLAAGVDGEAIALLCGADLVRLEADVGLLSTAIARAERLEMPASTLYTLRMAVLEQTPLRLDQERMRQYVPPVLAQLEKDSGLLFYRQLSHLPQAERLNQALAQTQQAYLATPPHERVHSLLDAIRELTRLLASMTSMAAATLSHELFEALPALEPLYPLSPALRVVGEIVRASGQWLDGAVIQSRATYEAVLARIAEPDRAGLESAHQERVRLAVTFTIALLEAAFGSDAAEQRAVTLEAHRELRVNAWQVRSLMHLAQGNLKAANKCSRRAQLLQTQDNLSERYAGSGAGMEMALHWRLGDIVGVKSRLAALSRMAARYPGWKHVEYLGRAAYYDVQGDLENALSAVTAGLALAPPKRMPFFAALAACHVHVLQQLGRVDEAVEHLRKYVTICRENESPSPDLYRYGALALFQSGAREEAFLTLESYIVRAEEFGSRGFALGAYYETGARMAAELKDLERFERYMERCAAEYEKSENPSLQARLTQLIELAHQRTLRPSARTLALPNSIQPPAAESEFDTVHSRMAECVDVRDRGRCALTLLLQETFCPFGLLYLTTKSGAPLLLAALPDPSEDPGLAAWLDRYVSGWHALKDPEADATESEATQSGTATGEGEGDELTALQSYRDWDGRPLQAVPLDVPADRGRRLVGVLVAQVREQEVLTLRRSLTESLAREFLDHEDAARVAIAGRVET